MLSFPPFNLSILSYSIAGLLRDTDIFRFICIRGSLLLPILYSYIFLKKADLISEFGIPSAIGILGRVKRSRCVRLVVACKTDMGDLSYDGFSRLKVPTYNKVLPI